VQPEAVEGEGITEHLRRKQAVQRTRYGCYIFAVLREFIAFNAVNLLCAI
jgi:hypothetical protein